MRSASLRALVRYASFPATLVATLAVCHIAMNAGVAPWLAAGVSTVIGLIFVSASEYAAPFRAAWSRSHGDVPTDVCHALINALMPELVRLGSYAALLGGGVGLRGLLGTTPWPSELPVYVQVTVALIVAEFFAYAFHRLTHEWEPLWPLHAPHHSAPRLYFLNAARFHPIDVIATQLLHSGPLLLLGCPGQVLALHAAFTAAHGLLQHGNVDFRLGPLNWIFSTPKLHRWHHSLDVREANSNYGANLIVWDILFRTRYLPTERDAPERIGIADMPNFPESYLEHLRSPFGWSRLQRLARR